MQSRGNMNKVKEMSFQDKKGKATDLIIAIKIIEQVKKNQQNKPLNNTLNKNI